MLVAYAPLTPSLPLPLPFVEGSTLLIEPFLAAGSTFPTGGPPSAISFEIPNNPALVGATLHLQSALVYYFDDYGSTGLGITSALAVTFL